MKLELYFDGAYRSNYDEEEYGCGWLIKENGKTILQRSFGGVYPTKGSNNLAEYDAVYDALKFIANSEMTFDRLTIYGDSRLVINQLKGHWMIKEGRYKETAIKVKEMLQQDFHNNVKFKWIRRESNIEADTLSKEGIKNKNRGNYE